MFDDFPKDAFEVVAPGGQVKYRGKGIFTGGQVIIPDAMAELDVGDEIRRRLPNGKDEVFIVENPQFYGDMFGLGAHYQVDVSRRGQMPPQTGGNYTIHVMGANARVNVRSTDQSINTVNKRTVFDDLRAEIEAKITSPHDQDVLLRPLKDLEDAQGTDSFWPAYERFVAVAAGHMAIIAPFLSVLGQAHR